MLDLPHQYARGIIPAGSVRTTRGNPHHVRSLHAGNPSHSQHWWVEIEELKLRVPGQTYAAALDNAHQAIVERHFKSLPLAQKQHRNKSFNPHPPHQRVQLGDQLLPADPRYPTR
jgi:hypothetical protein